MKFLCVPCDSPMKLQVVAPPERGSLSVVYECPECGYEMAMLTNPFETQLVQSLGVRIGPDAGVGGTSASTARGSDEGGPEGGGSTTGSGCPFASMLPPIDGARDDAGDARSAATGPAELRWTPGAEARLANIPAFVRPMARSGIDRFARERGAQEVDEEILDAAREFFGM